MACHYPTKVNQIPNGLYWVMINVPTFNKTINQNWALGVVRNGHFNWISYYQFDGNGEMPGGGGMTIQPITLKQLIEQRVPMVLVKKPGFKRGTDWVNNENCI